MTTRLRLSMTAAADENGRASLSFEMLPLGARMLRQLLPTGNTAPGKNAVVAPSGSPLSAEKKNPAAGSSAA